MSSSHSLPPLSHLPRWTRVGRLRKPSSPRPVAAKQQQQQQREQREQQQQQRELISSAAVQVQQAPAADPRISSLQRNIQFLQQQHKDTLHRLHAEIEQLKRENKDLHYKIIMEPPKSSRKGPIHGQRSIRSLTRGRETYTGLYLEEPLQNMQPSMNQALRSFGEGGEILGSARPDHGPAMKGSLITSLQPLLIHGDASCAPRSPTLQECEVLVRQLYNANSLQSQELIRVKALLRDIVLSKKISPENYILTKGYLVDAASKPEEKKFPKLGLQTYPDKRSGPSQSGVVLPALKQSLSPTVAERQRRTRAMQKERLKRTLH